MKFFESLKDYEFILGSQSPQRRKIVEEQLGIPQFKCVVSTFAEDLPKTGTHEDYVKNTCLQKCEHVFKKLEGIKRRIILCSDTIVTCGDKIFEKPENEEDHMSMFSHYKLAPVKVITAVVVVRVEEDGSIQKLCTTETTELEFDNNASPELIKYYIDSKEGSNAAGGFKIQGFGNVFFPRVIGDYLNVVGLPVYKTFGLLQDLLHHKDA